jgi:prophage maintenance system killer protein/prophage antirepressor-like protein
MKPDLGEIILYQSEDGTSALDVHLKDETVWLTLNQMAELFGRDKSVISRHLLSVFRAGELVRNSVVAKNATTAADGKTYLVEYFNFDAIISVGYRVNSKRGTQFRIWATQVLKEHLVQGYTFNQRRLAEKGVAELKQAMALLATTLESHELVSDEGRAVLEVVSRFAGTWRLLLEYDEDRLSVPTARHGAGPGLRLDEVRRAIAALKKELAARDEATDLFGQERAHGLAGILGAIEQSFAGQDLYPSVEEKAAHLLYFVIKDHPFSDGNKRIGSFLFILYLRQNGLAGFDNRALVALALLTATSEPGHKELLVRLIVNLIGDAG